MHFFTRFFTLLPDFESLALRQKKQSEKGCFFVSKKTVSRERKQGIRTRREHPKDAEENSPVDCFRRRGNERSEAIGAGSAGQNPLLSAKKMPCSCGLRSCEQGICHFFLIYRYRLFFEWSKAYVRRRHFARHRQNAAHLFSGFHLGLKVQTDIDVCRFADIAVSEQFLHVVDAVCMTASFGLFSLKVLLSIICPCRAKAMYGCSASNESYGLAIIGD